MKGYGQLHDGHYKRFHDFQFIPEPNSHSEWIGCSTDSLSRVLSTVAVTRSCNKTLISNSCNKIVVLNILSNVAGSNFLCM